MARLGDTINEAAFTRDYTGMANAGIMGAQGFSQLTDKIGGAFRDYSKEQKDAKNEVRSTGALIKAAATLFPEQKGLYDSLLNDLNNEDVPISERAALGPVMKELLSWNIAERTNQQEFGLKREQLDLQREDQSLRREAQAVDLAGANLQNQAKGMEIASFVQNQEMDQATKAGLGPGLLEETLKLTPEGMKADILKNIGDYDAAEQFDLASKIRGLLPKATQAKAPTLAEITVNGGKGKQTVEFNEQLEKWIPIQTGGLNGNADPSTLGAPPPDIMLPDGTVVNGDLATGVGVDGQAGVLPQRPGFTPTPPMDEKAKAMAEKYKVENEARKVAKASAVAKSETLLNDLEKLEKHPGLPDLFGVGFGLMHLPGTKGSDAKNLLKKIQGAGFVEAASAMKGTGAITDKDAEKLEASFVGLNPDMSEAAAKEQIQNMKKSVMENIKRIQGESAAQQPTVADPYAQGSSILNGLNQ